MSKPKTVEQWLKEKDLPTELGRVFTPEEEWEHDWFDNLHVPRCAKCQCDSGSVKSQKPCSVPGPIKVDWNTAMKWYRPHSKLWTYIQCLENIWRFLSHGDGDFTFWQEHEAQPKHFLIVAAMAAERKEG